MSDSDDFFDFDSKLDATEKDDTDLSGMDTEAAQEYVLGFLTALKQLQRQIMEVAAEQKGWQERILLAKERNREDLLLASEQKVKEFQAKIDELQAEERDLAFKVKEMMENFKKLKAGFHFSVDAEQLIAQLTMVVGEKDEVVQQFKEEETLSELEKMKAKLKTQEPPPGNSGQ